MKQWSTSLPGTGASGTVLTAEVWNAVLARIREISTSVPETAGDVGALPAAGLSGVPELVQLIDARIAAAGGVPGGGGGGTTPDPQPDPNPGGSGEQITVPFQVRYDGTTLAAKGTGAGVTATALTKGPALVNLNLQAAEGRYSAGPGATTKASALSGGQYVQATLTIPGPFAVTGLRVQVAKGSTAAGARGFVVKTSADNYSTEHIASETLPVQPSYATFTLATGVVLRGTDSLTVRLYVYTPGDFGLLFFGDLVVSGTFTTDDLGGPTSPDSPDVYITAAPAGAGELLATFDADVLGCTSVRVGRNGQNAAGGGPFSTVVTLNGSGPTTTLFTGLVNGATYTLTVTPIVGGTERADLAASTAGVPLGPITEPPDPDPDPSPDPNPGGGGPVNTTELDRSWQVAWDKAWNNKDLESLRLWFVNQNFGPTIPVSGTHSGGTISTQSQADAMAGKTVTGTVTITGNVTIHDAIFRERVDQTSGDVKYRDCLFDPQDQAKYDAYWRILNGTFDIQRCQSRRQQDGLKTYSKSTGMSSIKYLYIHDTSPTTGNLSGSATHQDGWQHMSGNVNAQRIYVDARGAKQSTTMWKSDHGPGSIRCNYSVFVNNNAKVWYIQDNPGRAAKWNDLNLQNCILAGRASGQPAIDLWNLNSAMVSKISSQQVKILPSGNMVNIRHLVKFP